MDMTAYPPPGWKLSDPWASLADEAAEANCFYAPELLCPALRHLQGKEEVRLIEAWSDGLLIGLLPVVTAMRHGRLQIPHVANWIHRHCYFGAPLLAKGNESAAWEHLLEKLDQNPRARGFLHLKGLDENGEGVRALRDLCRRQGRGIQLVNRYERAFLNSSLSATDYWETNMRAKKRKEIRRLQNRLQELGEVQSDILSDAADLGRWCEDFLELERRGWKGAENTAMACDPADVAFFRESITAAFKNERLMFLRLDLDGRPLAMLVNFLMGNGGFSFKIAFDETMARFSPGVLIEIENLRQVLDRNYSVWMDSCAAPGHPMIDSLWAERRTIVQYRVELKGRCRRLSWELMKVADRLAALIRKVRKK